MCPLRNRLASGISRFSGSDTLLRCRTGPVIADAVVFRSVEFITACALTLPAGRESFFIPARSWALLFRTGDRVDDASPLG